MKIAEIQLLLVSLAIPLFHYFYFQKKCTAGICNSLVTPRALWMSVFSAYLKGEQRTYLDLCTQKSIYADSPP